MSAKPWSIALRFPEVALARQDLEAALGLALDRFEPSRHGAGHYAQVNVREDGDIWADAAALAKRLGPAVLRGIARGEIGRPSADFAVGFYEDRATARRMIPREVAAALAQAGFDLEISVYPTQRDEG